MAIMINWKVVQIDTYPTLEELSDVVFNVHWSVTAIEDDIEGYAYGSQAIPLSVDGPYTPYAELTQPQVIGWVKDELGDRLEEIEAAVAKQVADKKNPPVVTHPLPW